MSQVFGDSDEEDVEGSTHSGDKDTRTPIDDEQDCTFVCGNGAPTYSVFTI